MYELLTFTAKEITLFISSMALALAVYIQLRKYFTSLIPRSFAFSSKHFMVGLSVAISSSIAIINWTTYDYEQDYRVLYIEEDPEIVKQIPTSTQPIKKEVVPPPPDKKITITQDLSKLNLVDDTEAHTEDEPRVDQEEVQAPAAPIAEVGTEDAAPIVAPELPEEDDTPIFISEQMPRFPGCEMMEGTKKEKEACSKKKLLAYIYKELKYPAVARENGIEGLVVLQFVVTKIGRIGEIKILKDPGGGCGNAAVRIVQEMNKLPESWTPGKQRGRPVNVMYTLPIKDTLN